MTRLTLALDDDLRRALKETAARQWRSIASITKESLRLCDITWPRGGDVAVVSAAVDAVGIFAGQLLTVAGAPSLPVSRISRRPRR